MAVNVITPMGPPVTVIIFWTVWNLTNRNRNTTYWLCRWNLTGKAIAPEEYAVLKSRWKQQMCFL